MPELTRRVLQNLNRHGISLFLSEELSTLSPDPFEDFRLTASVCFAFGWDAGEDDLPFRLRLSPLFAEAVIVS